MLTEEKKEFVWTKKEHDAAWSYPTKPRSFIPPPKSLTNIPKNDDF